MSLNSDQGDFDGLNFDGNLAYAFDQLLPTIENAAVLMAGYYKRLKDDGLPDDLARKLVADFNEVFWSATLNRRG
jgi:hypothetical protein